MDQPVRQPPGLSVLSTAECLGLLPTVPVGRIAFTRNALPAVVPVNFTLDGGHILIRTGIGSKLDAAIAGAVVAFEADDIDLRSQTGWSVMVVGPASRVTVEAAPRHRGGAEGCWAPGERNHLLRITCARVTGRRLIGRDTTT